jgi:hypothetical protein
MSLFQAGMARLFFCHTEVHMQFYPLLTALILSQSIAPYEAGQAQAIAAGQPHIVFLGCPARPLKDCVTSHAAALVGYAQAGVIVARPGKGTMWFVAQLPVGAADADIRTAAGLTDGGDALHEVNAVRQQRGLRPFLRDDGLVAAAHSAAAFRAARLIAGHTSNDFAHVPPGSSASSAGCAAWEPSWGWGACCTYENYTYAGAAYAIGSDGRRYMHLYVR